jgi:hypothetical protein
MSQIDIEMVFDAVTILNNPNYKKSLDPSKPTGIQHNDVFMITEKTYLDPGHTNSQATADLWVKAIAGEDALRWRSESLSDNIFTSVIVYDIKYFTGDHVTEEPVKKTDATTLVPVPNADGSGNVPDATKYHPETVTKYYLHADITKPGTEGYMVYFYITQRDRATGNIVVMGYYYWDPYIHAIS